MVGHSCDPKPYPESVLANRFKTSGTTITSGLRFDPTYTATDLTLTAAAILNGDADLNGNVNTADFNTLASDFNRSGQNRLTGDFNRDGMVNALDFNALASDFGSAVATPPLSSPLGAVLPEPSLGVLMLAGLLPRGGRRATADRSPGGSAMRPRFVRVSATISR